jgi:NADP-dependent 3-hydroxy acid dehydrogenase YdfG
MAKTIVVVGFGPGISTAVAEKFGSSGFAVALVARNEERLAAGVKALKAAPRPAIWPWLTRPRSATSSKSPSSG